MSRKRWSNRNVDNAPSKKQRITICANYCDGDLRDASRQFCRECACSLLGCGGPRSLQPRFCHTHLNTYNNLSRGYMDQYGEQKLTWLG